MEVSGYVRTQLIWHGPMYLASCTLHGSGPAFALCLEWLRFLAGHP